jgi:hypothetical protein
MAELPILSLSQINTWAWLPEMSRGLNRAGTLDDIPDAELGRARHA